MDLPPISVLLVENKYNYIELDKDPYLEGDQGLQCQ